jgi:HlyD family secretion protein
MSRVRPDIDLGALGRTSQETSSARPRRRFVAAIPFLIVLGFVAVLLSTLTDLFRGAVEVTVIRPRTAAKTSVAEGTVLLQAAGWIEPDPFPTRIGALATGVVKDILVRESAAVAAGDVVAILVDDEAKIDLATAQAELERARAAARKAALAAAFARESFAAALAVKEAEGSANAELIGKTAEAVHRREAVREGKARVRVAEEELATQKFLVAEGAAGPRQLELAEAKVEEAHGALSVMEADAALADAEKVKAAVRAERARRDLELRIDERAAVAAAEAESALAESEAALLEKKRDRAQLALDRMTVRSPVAGIVLDRLATPGGIVGPSAEHEYVCSLWDPENVRVRVDVPQGDIAKVEVGQKVDVSAEARSDRVYRGHVQRLLQKADIQKVTVQVHVRLDDADSSLRPEMLVQAKFFARANADSRPSSAGSSTARTIVEIPESVIVDGSHVWVIAAEESVATKRSLELGRRTSGFVEVLSGLNATDKIVDSGREKLSDGSRVVVREETRK